MSTSYCFIFVLFIALFVFTFSQSATADIKDQSPSNHTTENDEHAIDTNEPRRKGYFDENKENLGDQTTLNLAKAIAVQKHNNTLPGQRKEPKEVRTFCYKFKDAIYRAFNAFKVQQVLRNIGTCIVNGFMDLVSFYLPSPLIPLVAAAAGNIIPFEPVVTLRKRMPVNSYRRALNSAYNTFLGTFDYMKNDEDEDPYMTRRFNRRFMDKSSENKKKIEA